MIEFRQRPVTDDPAVSGKLHPGFRVTPPPEAPPPPTAPDEEEGDLFPAVGFAPMVEEQLLAGATREVELQVAGPAVLLSTVRWDGTSSPLNVTLSLDGAPVGTASSYTLGANRGGSNLTANAAAGGLARLTVTNTSSVTVTVKMAFGAVPR